MSALALHLAGEGFGRDRLLALDFTRQIILEAAGKAEYGLFRRVRAFNQRRRAIPADLDTAEQISLGPRHAEKARGAEMRALAENLCVGMEAHPGAATVLHRAELLQFRRRQPP